MPRFPWSRKRGGERERGGSPRPAAAATHPGLSRAVRRLLASIDAAETNDGNARHWAGADGASADAAMTVERRRVLRNRARYEVVNNSYARGIVNTLANDCVGTGPRLQMQTDDAKANEAIERAWARWFAAVDGPDKLRAMRAARVESGEVFAIIAENPGVDAPVQLDFRLIEADQVATPDMPFLAGGVDGIVFDRYGNPREYHVLSTHPGDALSTLDYAAIPAQYVIHYFRADRPGQSRGIPEITPAIPLFAMLRRYTLATVAAAEVAAMFAGILYSDAPANGDAEAVEPMDVFDLEPRSLLTAPMGWRLEQMRAEHPTTTYGDFKAELLNEIARCLNMPYNVAAGNSAKYNYASGRLDFQLYDFAIRTDRRQLERVVLDRLLAAFLREAVLVSDLLPLRARTLVANATGGLPSHQWFWDSRPHVDPSKEATAQGERLKNNTTTLASEYAREGRDWEAELRQRAKERELMRQLGIDDAAAAPTAPAVPATDNASEADNAEE